MKGEGNRLKKRKLYICPSPTEDFQTCHSLTNVQKCPIYKGRSLSKKLLAFTTSEDCWPEPVLSLKHGPRKQILGVATDQLTQSSTYTIPALLAFFFFFSSISFPEKRATCGPNWRASRLSLSPNCKHPLLLH